MSYEKHKWVNNVDAVDEDKMNHIENGIKDLDDNKVNKSGDTMTGELFFNNTDGYGAITKYRTVSGTNYSLALGLGGNGATRLENRGGGIDTSLEVRPDGHIWNATSNKKLAEQSNGWTNATLSSYIAGTVRYTKIGNIVIVNFSDVYVKSNLSHNVVLASGLPTSTVYQMTALTNFDAPGAMRVAINTSGQIVDHYSSNTADKNNYYGTLIYVTNQ